MKNLRLADTPLSNVSFKSQNDAETDLPSCKCISAQTVSENSYILHVTATMDSSPTVALGLTNNNCEVYKFSNQLLSRTRTLTGHQDTIVGVKFNPMNNDEIYTASTDGSVKLWDLRVPESCVSEFTDTTEEDKNKKKVFSCFDMSPNNRLLTVGTEMVDNDSFIIFWDIRQKKLLGGYWESHTEDITQVKFDLNNVNRLMSGSTDGLINLYDLTQVSEDDALIETLNSESSVDILDWINRDIFCLTHTHNIQFWNVEGAEPYLRFDREDIARKMKLETEFTYVIGCHQFRQTKFILAGSTEGDGECLRCLKIVGNNLKLHENLKENRQVVRCSWFNENINLLLTGGEQSTINAWKLLED